MGGKILQIGRNHDVKAERSVVLEQFREQTNRAKREREVEEEQAIEEEAKREGISKECKSHMIIRPATPEEVKQLEANHRRAEALAKIVKQAQPKKKRTKKPGRDPETGKYNDLIAEPKYR